MKFSKFCEQVVKIKKLPLPGIASHYKMEPEDRRELREKGTPLIADARRAAVMAICYPKNEEVYMLFILRKTYEGVHSNQIGFPGGKVEESDIDLLDTAKRETFEEVGILKEDIQLIKPLTEVYIPPSNFLVQPFLGIYKTVKPFIKDPTEVEALVEVKLTAILNDANMATQRLSTSYAKSIVVPTFTLNGQTVWGATAMILSEIKDLLKKIL